MPAGEVRGPAGQEPLGALLARATGREPLSSNDGKSGARMERVVVDGRTHILKHLCVEDDWTMRCTGDLVSRALRLWRGGLLAALPPSIDHTVVAVDMVAAAGRHPAVAVLMRDVSPWLVPPGDDPLPLEQHLRFLDHMAEMHAAFWGWEDDLELTPLGNRYLDLAPATADAEAGRGSPSEVPRLVAEGWSRFPAVAPRAAEVVLPLLADPDPLLVALQATPATFVHGNWKAGNLGSHPDGRTILIDWGELPGQAPAGSDLAWYLALNAARLPHAKEEAIAAYRAALERRGVATGGWWDAQVSLCLLGSLVQFGWEKALGGAGPELAWWEDRAVEGAAYLA